MPEFEVKHKQPPVKKKKKKKENIFVSIFSGLLPWKGDSAGDIVRKIIFLVSIAILVYALLTILNFYVFRDNANTAEAQKWAQLKNESASDDKISIVIRDADDKTDNTDSDSGEEVEVLSEYVQYYEENNDFVGWISIYPYVNYPVAQSDDNDFYLKHNFDKVPTANGTIFADYQGIFTPTERPNNIILYGHNLITNNYFQPLSNYRKDIEFFKDNCTFDFDTLYARGKYKIFSVFLTNTKSEHGDVFNYNHFVYFNNRDEFFDFVSECLDRSYYYTDVDLEYGDEIMTLSTCDFSMFSDMRLVVVARRVRDGESPNIDTDKIIDNTGFDENGNVRRKMFQAYYDNYGCQWAGRSWDTSLVKDFDKYNDENGTIEIGTAVADANS